MMTKIFNSYTEFILRSDNDMNGVSPLFAKENPEWEKENETNKGCWDCYNCSDCSDCEGCYNCSNCSNCSDCSDCEGCYICSNCSNCSDCEGCYNCSDCSDLLYTYNGELLIVPVVENIHQKVYEAVQKDGALDMNTWHTCETTHCRAGWVVHLAGEAGYELEKKTTCEFSALMIYKKSSSIPVNVIEFYDEYDSAMESIRKAAENEKLMQLK